MTYNSLNALLDTLYKEGYEYHFHDLYELCLFARNPSGYDCIIYYDKFWIYDDVLFQLKEIKLIVDMN